MYGSTIGSGGQSGAAVRIHRIGLGGWPVTGYGNAAITDPDCTFCDATGRYSGTPDALIVGETQLNSQTGKPVIIQPDQTVTTLYGPTAFNFNPNVFACDLGGRLLFSDDLGGKVWTLSNGVATVLGTGFGAPWGMAFGPDDALYVSEFTGDLIWRVGSAEPRLAIRREDAAVVVWWSSDFPDWNLEWTGTLGAGAAWSVIPRPYATNATEILHTEADPTAAGVKFYRLTR